jgi:hypothetical protein
MHWGTLEITFALHRAIVLSGRRCELDADKFNALLARHSNLANVSDCTAVGGGLGLLKPDLHDLASFKL